MKTTRLQMVKTLPLLSVDPLVMAFNRWKAKQPKAKKRTLK